MEKDYTVQCPYCGFEIQVSTDWVTNNDLLFCGNCTKAFDLDSSMFVDKEDFEEF